MSKRRRKAKPLQEGLISALAFGGFLIILSLAFGLTPEIPQKIGAFFNDLTTVSTPVINGSMIFLAPAHPSEHSEVYGALFNFTLGITILQAVILVIRFIVHSRIGKIAETVGNLVFWGGTTVVNSFLQAGTLTGWFTFWASLIILAGLSLITQFIIRIIAYRRIH